MGRIDKELLNYHSKYSKDGVLINKLKIENEEELNKAERLITSYKLSKMYLRDEEISFDVSYYLNIHKELFGDIGDRYNSLFNGRPDVLIEVRELSTKKLVKAIIGEVKHTTDRDYAIQGLKELIEYINYIKQKISSRYEYISNIREIDIKGMLFLDNIKVNQLTNKDIKIITIRERETKIELDFQ